MAVQRMKFVTLAAPVEQFDQVALRCVIDQQFHPENAQQVMRQVRHLRPLAAATNILRLCGRRTVCWTG